jgi:hypothetical protein
LYVDGGNLCLNDFLRDLETEVRESITEARRDAARAAWTTSISAALLPGLASRRLAQALEEHDPKMPVSRPGLAKQVYCEERTGRPATDDCDRGA